MVSKFSFKKTCLAAEKFRSGTLQCATYFRYRKLSGIKAIIFSVKSFLYQIAEKYFGGTDLCSVSEKFW